MITVFDYGTSNCAIGAVMPTTGKNSSVTLLPLDHGRAFMPSTLYALERELVSEFVGLNIHDKAQQEQYAQIRAGALEQARRVRFDEGIESEEQPSKGIHSHAILGEDLFKPLFPGKDWLPPVKGFIEFESELPVESKRREGDRYVFKDSEYFIKTWNGTHWVVSSCKVKENAIVLNQSDGNIYEYNGVKWVLFKDMTVINEQCEENTDIEY